MQRRIRLSVIWYFGFLLSVGTAVTFAQQVDGPPFRDDGWQVGTPQQAGFDLDRMQALTDKLQSGGHTNAHVVIVEYDGKLVYEQYLSGEDQNWGTDYGQVEFDYDVRHDLRSISKSVTALLLGIALGENFETTLSQPVIEFFPEYSANFSPGMENITLHHVLTMSAGLEWNEMQVPYSNLSNDYIRLYHTADPFEFVLSKPVRTEPGVAWHYNGGTSMLLAGIIQKLTGKTFLSYAEEALFDPLGISDYEWRGDGIWRRGLPAATSGLRLRGRDLAKIGSLMIHNGKWNGNQVIPAEWIRVSSMRHMEQTNSKLGMGGIYGYGYQWWHGKFTEKWDNATVITGLGYGGQKMFVVPEKGLVVTVFAGNYGKGNWTMPEEILAEVIAAAP